MQALTKFVSIELLSCAMSWSVITWISVVLCVKLSVSTRLSYGEHHKIVFWFVDLAVLICHLVIAIGILHCGKSQPFFGKTKKQKKKKKKKKKVWFLWAGQRLPRQWVRSFPIPRNRLPSSRTGRCHIVNLVSSKSFNVLLCNAHLPQIKRANMHLVVSVVFHAFRLDVTFSGFAVQIINRRPDTCLGFHPLML